MKKRKLFVLFSSMFIALALPFSGVFASYKQDIQVVEAADYYSGISDSLDGTDLLNALNQLNNTKRKKMVTYANMRYYASTFDADPDGSGKIVGFYDNVLVGPSWDGGSTWNREHVWPNIRGGSSVEDDAHMTRPASTQTNSDRGSKGYGMKSYDPGQFVAYYRGAASRIIFYAAMADLNLKLVDDPLNYNGVGSGPANAMGSLSEMLKWNLQYKPTNTYSNSADDLARRTEINRNNQIEKAYVGQGNRNPFIDHPEYACRIWGKTNANTRAACNIRDDGSSGDTSTDVALTGVELNIHTKTIAVGETFNLTAAYNPTNATNKPTLYWSSTDEKVATINNGVVTGLANGTCSILVITADSMHSDFCKVTVGTGKKDDTKPLKVSCGGNIATTSLILSSISLLSICLLLIRRFKR